MATEGGLAHAQAAGQAADAPLGAPDTDPRAVAAVGVPDAWLGFCYKKVNTFGRGAPELLPQAQGRLILNSLSGFSRVSTPQKSGGISLSPGLTEEIEPCSFDSQQTRRIEPCSLDGHPRGERFP